ncbi:thermonuclease family protein [Maricaulis sp.]|uniref:thermonuclease family protein n=1 Tax=Maricaulis sp. TaxID=1486257 RepID=UPI003A9550A0
MPDVLKLIVMLFVVACEEPGIAFEPGETGQVVAISGPLTLALETAEGPIEVRLAELDAPDAEAGRRWLETHLPGQEVRLRYDGVQRDRYDRAIAQVYLPGAGEEVWVQAAMVSAGRARVLSHPGNRGAALSLLRLEADARADGVGLWADPAFRVRDTDPDRLAQDIGSVQLVEGRVLEVTRLRSGRTYVNFGLDYRTDFTVQVEAADEAAFEAADQALADLEGRRIRVRGWLEAENGPLMRIDHPERIEWLEE